MLESVKIQRRQSEIRQALAELAAKAEPTEDEIRTMDTLDREYRSNETRYRAALIAEDTERREAGADLETRAGSEWRDLVAGFELRQAALYLDEGRVLEGATADVVQELRSQGGFRGVPVPYGVLEQRVGETIASGTPDPMQTRPIVDRLFPQSVAAQMGGEFINVGTGSTEWPVVTSSVTAGWAASETGNVAGPTVFDVTPKGLSPDHTLGITMRVTRKALMQSGPALEAAIRRDMAGTMAAELDRAIFLGTGASGQPDGIVSKANSVYGITESAVNDPAGWEVLKAEVVAFMTANLAAGPGDVGLLIRPELWANLDGWEAFEHTGITEWARAQEIGRIVQTANALAAPTGSPEAVKAIMTTSAGGFSPFFVGLWGAVDLIRDPYSDATSGGLRLTALSTVDIAVPRAAQMRVLTGIELPALVSGT